MGDTDAGCVLFADVSGSTKLYETAGDTTAHEAIDLCFFLYREGIRLERTVGHTLLRFKSNSEETAEIVGELLCALMR